MTMKIWLPVLMMAVVTIVALRLWLKERRRRIMATRRRIEAPNSHYSSAGVRNLEDRERWGTIDVGGLHPLNREEVQRLLYVVDSDGISALSRKDRLFLDNMTVPRLG